jgi:hypothetical protein
LKPNAKQWHNKVLDPQISYEGLEADCSDGISVQELDNAKDRLKEYYQANYATKVQVSRPTNMSPSVMVETSRGSPQKVDFTSWYKKRARSFDEFNEYFRLPLEPFDGCDPIQWWVSRRAQYPNLSCLALDLLSIPGM